MYAKKDTRPWFLRAPERDASGEITRPIPRIRVHCAGRMEFYEVPKGSHQWFYYNDTPVSASDIERNRLHDEAVFPKIVTPLSLDEQIAIKQKQVDVLDAQIAAKSASKEVAPKADKVDVQLSVGPKDSIAKVKEELRAKTAGSSFASQVKEAAAT